MPGRLLAALVALCAGCNAVTGIGDYAPCPECFDGSAEDSSREGGIDSAPDATGEGAPDAWSPDDTTDATVEDTGPVDTGPPPPDVTDVLVDTGVDCSTKADGFVCGTSPRAICLKGSCKVSQCGDLYVDAVLGEECEDGNKTNGDGCENSCKWTCTTAAMCDDKIACNGTETCDTVTHKCKPGTPIDADGDGDPCGKDCDDTDPTAFHYNPDWYSTPRKAGGFDHDCSLKEEKRYPVDKCSNYGTSATCPGAGFNSFEIDVACGVAGTFILSCVWVTGTSDYCGTKYFDSTTKQECH